MKTYILSITTLVFVFVGLLIIVHFLVKRDENTVYSFNDLQLQFGDGQDGKMCFYIRYYVWQLHKQREIREYYQKAKIIITTEHFYEITESREAQRCSDYFLQNMFLYYVEETKVIDKTFIEGNMVYVFADKTIYFNTKPYLNEIIDMYKFVCNSKIDENEEKRICIVLDELYGLMTTNVIYIQKLGYYIETINLVKNPRKELMLLNVLIEIAEYFKKLDRGFLGESRDMEQNPVTWNIWNQLNIGGDVESVCTVNYNDINIDAIIENIKKNILDVSESNGKKIIDAIEQVKEEINKEKPNKNKIRNGIDILTSMMTLANGIPNLAQNINEFIDYVKKFIK